jgi:3-keto-5-aminohexanoate cleavage enzyme
MNSDRTACIIELRANEFTRRSACPAVPLGPDEIVADALEAQRAGASILHWHARDPDTGREVGAAAPYVAVCRGVRAHSDMLLHPTLGSVLEQDATVRTRQIAEVLADPSGRIDLVPVDFGSINVDLWDAGNRRFRTEDRMYLNPRQNLRRMLETFRDLGVAVVSVCWTVGHVRTARCFQQMGLLDAALWQLVFTGESLPDGTAPTRAGLDAMVEHLPAGEPWSVMCLGADIRELASWAIGMGGHVATGLGDWPYPRLGSPRNAEVVADLAELVEHAGRSVATPAEARALLGLLRS